MFVNHYLDIVSVAIQPRICLHLILIGRQRQASKGTYPDSIEPDLLSRAFDVLKVLVQFHQAQE